MSSAQLLGFLGRRVAALGGVLIVVSFAIFALLHLAPGSVDQTLLGARPATPEAIEAIRAHYDLDQPFLVQYWHWARGALSLDFGESARTGEPVLSAISARAGVTAFLVAYAFVLAVGIGVPLGILTAVKRRTALDRAVVTVSVIGISIPAFVTSLLAIYVFSIELGWFPVFGEGSGFTDRLYHLTLPAFALAFTVIALLVRLTRTAMTRALEQDHVTFARAGGVPERRILLAYGLRNALIPVLTAGGLVLVYLLTGAVLVEVTFGLQGVGALLVESVNFEDVPMVQGIALLMTVAIVGVNVLTDLSYLLADPRIRLERGRV